MEKRSRLWWKLLTRSFCQPAKRLIGSPCTYMLNKLVLWLATAIDISMTYGGPVYVIVGFSLILVVSYVYLATILPCIPGLLYQTLHLASGAVLLVNIILNYWLCTRTRPGSTASLKEGYHLAAGSSIKFCKHCRRAKPPLAHHCHICNECVLRMDHHCPWVNNCIGYFNYRYFFLFVLFLFLGSGYVAIQFWRRLTSAELVLTSNELRMMVFSLATSASSCFALGLLLCWHVYLILTAQSTVDFLRNRSAAMEARRQGKRWSNPYDLGAVPNWQDTFDVHGRFWWLLWLLPTWTPKKGNGFVLPTKNSQGVDSNSNADGFLTPRYPKDLETGHM